MRKKKCFDHHWVAGWDFSFLCFFLVMCLSLGSVILYWLGVSSFNAPWVVRHQAFYLLLHPRLCVISSFSFALLHTQGRVHEKFKQLCNEETGSGLMEGGNTRSVAPFRVRSSSGIPNAAAARDCFNRRLLGRIQTMSKWLSKVTT